MFVNGGGKCKEVLVLGGIVEVQGSIGRSVEGSGADTYFGVVWGG